MPALARIEAAAAFCEVEHNGAIERHLVFHDMRQQASAMAKKRAELQEAQAALAVG